MIAAQLLAYYFTELKDDQVKKVSFNVSFWVFDRWIPREEHNFPPLLLYMFALV